MHTLAVSVHNASVTSSDLGFDLRLFTIVDPTGGNGEFTNWAEENGLSDRPAEDQAMDADPDGDGSPTSSNMLLVATHFPTKKNLFRKLLLTNQKPRLPSFA